MKKPAKKRRAKNPRDAELRAQPEGYSGQLFKPAADPEADREELRRIAEQYEAYATLLKAEPFTPPDLMGRVLAVAEAARMGSEEPDEELAGITRHVEDPLTGDEIDVMCDALTASTMLRRLKLAFKSGLR